MKWSGRQAVHGGRFRVLVRGHLPEQGSGADALRGDAINGKQGVLEKVDTYTVKFRFPEPYYMLPDVLAGSTDLAGQAWRARSGSAATRRPTT